MRRCVTKEVPPSSSSDKRRCCVRLCVNREALSESTASINVRNTKYGTATYTIKCNTIFAKSSATNSPLASEGRARLEATGEETRGDRFRAEWVLCMGSVKVDSLWVALSWIYVKTEENDETHYNNDTYSWICETVKWRLNDMTRHCEMKT